MFGDEAVNVASLHLFDHEGTLVGEVSLEHPIVVGRGDQLHLDIRWKNDQEMFIRMNVLCPECSVNYISDTAHDYVCSVCRNAMSDGD